MATCRFSIIAAFPAASRGRLSSTNRSHHPPFLQYWLHPGPSSLKTPADLIAGRDPQLEKAIEVVMAALKKSRGRRRSGQPIRSRAGRYAGPCRSARKAVGVPSPNAGIVCQPTQKSESGSDNRRLSANGWEAGIPRARVSFVCGFSRLVAKRRAL